MVDKPRIGVRSSVFQVQRLAGDLFSFMLSRWVLYVYINIYTHAHLRIPKFKDIEIRAVRTEDKQVK